MGVEAIEGKRIAVVGGGQVGGPVALEGLRRNAEITVMDRNVRYVTSLVEAGAKFHRVDVRDRKSVNEAFKGQGFDAVVNLVAAFGQSTNPARAWATNVEGQRNLLRAGEDNNLETFIYTSTLAVYAQSPYEYGDTKREGEFVLSESSIPNKQTLRLANVLGTQIFRNPHFRIPYVGVGIGKLPKSATAEFSYVTPATVAEAVYKSMSAEPNQTVAVIDGNTTMDEFLGEMARINKIRLRYEFSGDTMIYVLDTIGAALKKFHIDTPLAPATARFLMNHPHFDPEEMERTLGIKGVDFRTAVRQTAKQK